MDAEEDTGQARTAQAGRGVVQTNNENATSTHAAPASQMPEEDAADFSETGLEESVFQELVCMVVNGAAADLREYLSNAPAGAVNSRGPTDRTSGENKSIRTACTALIVASANKQAECVKVLLAAGADPHLEEHSPRTGNGRTALTKASFDGEIAIVRALLDAGAEANHHCHRDRATALIQASQEGNDDIVRLLIERGADPQLGQADERTPAHFAAHRGHNAILRFLAKCGSSLDIKDESGWTPLMAAARTGQLSTVRMLAEEFGADVNNSTHYDRTPLSDAFSQQHHAVAAYLIRKGADRHSSAVPSSTFRRYIASNETAHCLMRAHPDPQERPVLRNRRSRQAC